MEFKLGKLLGFGRSTVTKIVNCENPQKYRSTTMCVCVLCYIVRIEICICLTN